VRKRGRAFGARDGELPQRDRSVAASRSGSGLESRTPSWKVDRVKIVASLVCFGLSAVTVVGACSPNHDSPLRNGVNDVKKACEVRAAWAHPGAEKCINCITAAPAPACDCEQFKEFGALCQKQEETRHAEASCTSAIDDCTRACAKTDCACVDNCYAQAPSCKSLAAARDGCVADVCAPYCN
jgi:hypothetical protein